MFVFQVTALTRVPDLQKAITEHYGESNLMVASNAWLVADNAVTVREVAEKLSLTKAAGSPIEGIVIRVEAYYGYASTAIWEWIEVKKSA